MSTKKIREALAWMNRYANSEEGEELAAEAMVEVKAIERAAKVMADCKMSGTAAEYDAAMLGVADVMLAIAKEAQ